MTVAEGALDFSKGSKALYIQIKELFREKILSGELRTGDRIESEVQIQKKYGVSRITARQAVLDLEREGLVSRGRGRGTFVIWEGNSRKNSRSGQMDDEENGEWAIRVPENNRELESIYTQIVREEVLPSVALEFEAPVDQMLYSQVQINARDGVPVCYAKSTYNHSRWVSEEQEADLNRAELLQIVLENIEESQHYFKEEFSADLPDQEVRIALRISDEVPMLCKKRRIFDQKGNLMELRSEYFRGDQFSYLQYGTCRS